MFTPLEEKQIIKLNHRLSHDLTIGLVASRHTSSRLFHEFCEELTRLVPKIKISKVEADPQDPPQILIGSGLRYQAIPSGYELQPFLEALAAFESNSLKIAEPVKILLKKKYCRHIYPYLSPLNAPFAPRWFKNSLHFQWRMKTFN
jgi:alkyl hydroperoxide reductase subunit AhpF